MQDPWGDTDRVGERAMLTGRSPPFARAEIVAIAVFVGVGLWFRVRGLSAEGLGDDEVHKWLAANRYLHGDFSGDDVEHPMLMKLLIALTLLVGQRFHWALETITRLPNALAGGVSVGVVALLGRRLFGRVAGLIGSALAAVSVTFIGYQRVAKEDTLLGLFLMVLCLCMAEAKAAADDRRAADARRWELGGAASLAGMLASKYFFFLTPIPVVFYLWVQGTVTAWRVPPKRWLQLIGVAFVLWVACNWTPFLPATWRYATSYVSGGQTVHGSLFFMGHIHHNLVEYGLRGTPPWFYLVFAAVKLTPATLTFAMIGLVVALRERKPAHRLVLSWMGVWFLVHSLLGSKWGRFFTSVLPTFLILAGMAAALVVEQVRLARRQLSLLATATLTLVLAGSEAQATITHAPHERLYISPIGGGDRNVTWFFPHCDYFDAGFREAVQFVAANAESGAELSTELSQPYTASPEVSSALYTNLAGRRDLIHTIMRRGIACRSGRVCYVVVQTGRLYFLNQDAVAYLSTRTPWHVERIRGVDVVKVYRLEPGESPYPDDRR